MKQVVTVWGSPESGKTTLAVKLASAVSRNYSVILVLCDMICPALPYVAPSVDMGNKSLGKVITAPDITQRIILQNLAGQKSNENLGVLGYAKGEGLYTYSRPSEQNLKSLIMQLRHMADFVVFDTSHVLTSDLLSTTAINSADMLLKLQPCNLKGASYFASQRTLLPIEPLRVMSKVEPESDVALYAKEYGGSDMELAYSAELKRQGDEGTLLEDLRGARTFDSGMSKIVEVITSE
ncbi:ATPase AAA [Clostridia bacterium]|nr:ATPase AAA [Clostridia bacterium]GHV36821.1 ATPase AAA [Clostridia bacterium]